VHFTSRYSDIQITMFLMYVVCMYFSAIDRKCSSNFVFIRCHVLKTCREYRICVSSCLFRMDHLTVSGSESTGVIPQNIKRLENILMHCSGVLETGLMDLFNSNYLIKYAELFTNKNIDTQLTCLNSSVSEQMCLRQDYSRMAHVLQIIFTSPSH
jgi:hypothetical protein